jgi:hypothetical protein
MTFRKLALLPSSGEWRGRREGHLLSWAPQTELASITGRSSSDGGRKQSRLPKRRDFNFLIFCSSDDG